MVRSRLGLRQKVWSAEVMGLRPIRTRIRPLSDFLATESAGGIALVAAAFVALLWANSPWSESYERMWSEVLEVRLGSLSLTMDLRHWLNDGLMAIFFLVAGLEIKREIVEGELRDGRHRALPVVAALGGMLTPALLYVSFNSQGPWVQGWGIPMATDIALVVGVMSLAGNRVDPRLKLFLLALAIVDDIGAILVIGLFYGGQGDRRWLLIGGLVVLVALSLRRRAVQLLSVYVILGIGLWLSLHQAGIHPTISGVIMGLLAPTKPYLPPELIDETELLAIGSVESVVDTRRLARSTVSVVEWLEHRLHPWTSFGIIPLFAFANAGISMSAESLQGAATSPVAWGVMMGLMVGKPIGILLFSAIAVRVGVASLPSGARWTSIGGVGLLAGMGFTVSVLIAELALNQPVLNEAKVAILGASITAGAVGLFVLRHTSGGDR
jgi:Na+:H+ antiporter, NhaA family